MQLNEFIRNITYLVEAKVFYDSQSTKSWPEAEFQKVLEYKFDLSPEKAKQVSDSIRDLRSGSAPRPSLTKAQARKQSRKAALERAYAVLRSELRLYRADEKLAVGLFQANKRGEIVRRGELDANRFSELLLSSKTLLARLNEALQEEPELGDLTAKDLAQALYALFVSDVETLIDGDVPQMAWDKGPAFRVLDSRLIKPGAHPTWDQFLTRLDYPETFKAFVWSIFVPTNFGRQVLWIRGEGNDGKSTVVNAIADFFGRHATLSLGKNLSDNPFFFGSAYGKRLALYMDCKNTQLIREEKIMSLTGGDTVDINEKFQAAYSARVYSKILVVSNFNPTIDSSEAAERTRLLLIEVSPRANNELGDHNFEPNLQAEIGHFLYSCKVAYAEQCPKGMNLTVPPSMAERIEAVCINDDTNALDEFLDQYLEFGADYFVSRTELHHTFMKYLANSWTKSDYKMVHLVRRLSKMRGVESRRVGSDGQRVRGFSGVRLRGAEASSTIHILSKKGANA